MHLQKKIMIQNNGTKKINKKFKLFAKLYFSAFFVNFCLIKLKKIYLSGNTVRPQKILNWNLQRIISLRSNKVARQINLQSNKNWWKTPKFSFLFRQKISEVRQRNLWESPQTDLTSKVKNDFDFQDAWTLAGRPGTSKTCRFDTHIDYIFCNATWLSKYSVDKVEHVEDTASDHNMVIATFKTLWKLYLYLCQI